MMFETAAAGEDKRYNDDSDWLEIGLNHLVLTFPNIRHLDLLICLNLASCWLAGVSPDGSTSLAC